MTRVPRQIFRRQQFEEHLRLVNIEFLSATQHRGAPEQYTITRKYRRRIARARLKRQRKGLV